MKTTIILCEDEPESAAAFRDLTESYAKQYHMDIELLCYGSGEELLHEWENGVRADIIYLDIPMGEMNGIETARALRKAGCKAQIVFWTACGDYVYDAFDVGALHYLIKGSVSQEKFNEVLKRAFNLIGKNEPEMFICNFNGIKTLIPINQITYFEIWKRLITVHYAEKIVKFYKSMEELEQELAPLNFVRCHRSYLISVAAITELRRNQITLKTGEVLPVGQTYCKSLLHTFSRYKMQDK